MYEQPWQRYANSVISSCDQSMYLAFMMCRVLILFLQDVFVPTQSQEAGSSSSSSAAPQQTDKKTQSQTLESAPFTLPLHLSVNTDNSSSALQTLEHIEDSQATQIEEVEELPVVDTSDAVISRCPQQSEANNVTSESQTATSSRASTTTDSPKPHERAKTCEASNLSQKSDVGKCTATTLNVQNVHVSGSKSESKGVSSADSVSCSQPKFDSTDLTINICLQETPSDTTPSSLPSQSVISQTSCVDVTKSVESVVDSRRGRAAKSQSQELSQECVMFGISQTDKDGMGDGDVEEEEELLMEQEGEESTVGGGASGLALALSQSQVLSPEPMEEENDSVILLKESERLSQVLEKDATPLSKTNGSQPVGHKLSVSTNGHESQAQSKEKHVAPARLSQTEKVGPEPEGLKDKSLSDSSGGKLGTDTLCCHTICY